MDYVGRAGSCALRSTGAKLTPCGKSGPAACYFDRTRVVLDNRKGAEPEFVASLRAALGAAGFEVELREPPPQARYDTSVHLVVEGVSVRVPDELGRGELAAVVAAVREVEAHRRSERGRYRAVRVYRGETGEVLAWVDIFG